LAFYGQESVLWSLRMRQVIEVEIARSNRAFVSRTRVKPVK
jgi:hypothetical protein